MKQMLNVAHMGHPVLREIAEPVDLELLKSDEFQDFIDSMFLTMHEYDGVGLAAPQVHQSVRVAVFHENAGLPGPEGEPLIALVNPVITPLTEDESSMWEGCLSGPGLRGLVYRPDRVRVQGLDRDGNELDFEMEGFPAIVIQHECDHLDGVLYVDRLKDPKDLVFEKEFERFILPPSEDEEGDEDEEADENDG